jgi:2'-5' RNA ligase
VSGTGRAFVAVVPPAEVLDAVAAAIVPLVGLAPGARWTTRAQWHVTLRFLGNHVDLDAVAEGLQGLVVPGGHVRLGGGGAFPHERRGRVLWTGITEGAEVLGRLADGVDALVAPLGHDSEDRPYHAHLTLARLSAPGDLRSAVAALPGAAVGPAWRVDEVVLFRSHTRSEGARYEPFARVPLPLAPGTDPDHP